MKWIAGLDRHDGDFSLESLVLHPLSSIMQPLQLKDKKHKVSDRLWIGEFFNLLEFSLDYRDVFSSR